ncbi:MAG: hypothetical protein M1823_000362 [Watsoniomyces obsoletus]|nr:MAG: hypothetical protein M1823_000362 [Watsoniomyces obsoletus]
MHQFLHLLGASVVLLTGSTALAGVLHPRSPQIGPPAPQAKAATMKPAARPPPLGYMYWMEDFIPGTVTSCSHVRPASEDLPMVSVSEAAFGARRKEICGRSVEIRLPRDPGSNAPPPRTWGVVWDFCQDCDGSTIVASQGIWANLGLKKADFSLGRVPVNWAMPTQEEVLESNGWGAFPPGSSRPSKKNQQGQWIDDKKRLVNDRGQLIDPQGRLVNGKGQRIDGQGRIIRQEIAASGAQEQNSNAGKQQPGINKGGVATTPQSSGAGTAGRNTNEQAKPITPPQAQKATPDRSVVLYDISGNPINKEGQLIYRDGKVIAPGLFPSRYFFDVNGQRLNEGSPVVGKMLVAEPQAQNPSAGSSVRLYDISGNRINMRGELISGDGKVVSPGLKPSPFYFNAQGHRINMQGQRINGNGQPVEDKKPVAKVQPQAPVQAQNPSPKPSVPLYDISGNLINKKGERIDGEGNVISKGRITSLYYYNKNKQRINEQGQLINERGQRINEQRQRINEQGQPIKEDDQPVEDKKPVAKVQPQGPVDARPSNPEASVPLYDVSMFRVNSKGERIDEKGNPTLPKLMPTTDFYNKQGQRINVKGQLITEDGRLIDKNSQPVGGNKPAVKTDPETTTLESKNTKPQGENYPVNISLGVKVQVVNGRRIWVDGDGKPVTDPYGNAFPEKAPQPSPNSSPEQSQPKQQEKEQLQQQQ